VEGEGASSFVLSTNSIQFDFGFECLDTALTRQQVKELADSNYTSSAAILGDFSLRRVALFLGLAGIPLSGYDDLAFLELRCTQNRGN
jgi:hypothetical protein